MAQDGRGKPKQRVLVGRALPRGFVILGPDDLVLGRGRECQAPILADGISRRHARVFFDGAGHSIVDLGSTNGTVVNGETVAKARRLRPDDTIQIGPVKLKLVLTEASREELACQYDPRIVDTDRCGTVKRREVQIAGAFSGSVLIEACQLVELNKHSGEMRIETEGLHGWLRFREGTIVDAKLGLEGGERAVRRILGARSGEYGMQVVPAGQAPTGPLAIRPGAIAMEVVRLQDEEKRLQVEAARAKPVEDGFADEARGFDPDEVKPPDPAEATRKIERPAGNVVRRRGPPPR